MGKSVEACKLRMSIHANTACNPNVSKGIINIIGQKISPNVCERNYSQFRPLEALEVAIAGQLNPCFKFSPFNGN